MMDHARRLSKSKIVLKPSLGPETNSGDGTTVRTINVWRSSDGRPVCGKNGADSLGFNLASTSISNRNRPLSHRPTPTTLGTMCEYTQVSRDGSERRLLFIADTRLISASFLAATFYGLHRNIGMDDRQHHYRSLRVSLVFRQRRWEEQVT